jgi:hypothetical protein
MGMTILEDPFTNMVDAVVAITDPRHEDCKCTQLSNVSLGGAEPMVPIDPQVSLFVL